MNNHLDGAIVIDCTNVPATAGKRAQIIRPLAPMALHHECAKRGHPSTMFDYFWLWDNDDLLDCIDIWSKKVNSKKPLLLTSSLFNQHLLTKGNKVYEFVKEFKKRFPNSLYFTGGPIAVLDPKCDIVPDAIFRGRSLHLFSRWLDKPDEPLLDTITVYNNHTVYHRNTTEIIEGPIVPTLYDDYCLTESDILNFETRLGCKFNCTFCNFEYRNAKNTTDADQDILYEFFNTANKKYGVKYFSCVDDTFNEEDVKLERVAEVVRRLDFKPTIVGYIRFDLLKARPWQMPLLDEIGFWGLNFGIETLHREASKNIRKGMHREDSLNFLDEIRQQYPHWWLVSGWIVGIPPEPVEHVHDTWDEIVDRNLLDGFYIQELGIYKHEGTDTTISEISRNPEKFGITITGVSSVPYIFNWKTPQMTNKIANMVARQIAAKAFKRGTTLLDVWEAISRTAIGVADLFDVEGKKAYRQSLKEEGKSLYYGDTYYELGNNHVTQYIQRKRNYIQSL